MRPQQHRVRLPRATARGGTAVIEFALVFPLLLLVLAALIDFGRWFWVQAALNYAVQAAARCAALGSCTDVPGYAAQHAYGLSISNPAQVFTYTPSAACATPPAGGTVAGARVAASYAITLFLLPAGPIMPAPPPPGGSAPGSLTLTASACYPK
jgi:Flp pilus assembly protein TadG